MHRDVFDDVARWYECHERVKVPEGAEADAGVSEAGGFLSEGSELVFPVGEGAAAESVAFTAVELFDECAAPACGESAVWESAVDVLAYSCGYVVCVGTCAAAEDFVFFTVPVIGVCGIVVGLMHVLVDTVVNLDSGGVLAHADFGWRGACDGEVGKFFYPVVASGLAYVFFFAAFGLYLIVACGELFVLDFGGVFGAGFVGFELFGWEEEFLTVAPDDELWEGDFAVGFKADFECSAALCLLVCFQSGGGVDSGDGGEGVLAHGSGVRFENSVCRLFVAQGGDRVKVSGFDGGENAGYYSYGGAEEKAEDHGIGGQNDIDEFGGQAIGEY